MIKTFEKGKRYLCIKDFHEGEIINFEKGKIYYSDRNDSLELEEGGSFVGMNNPQEYFRLATEFDTEKTFEFEKDNEIIKGLCSLLYDFEREDLLRDYNLDKSEALDFLANIANLEAENESLSEALELSQQAVERLETEDEKMLREIKTYIKEQGDKPEGLPNGSVAVADMLAWLEKKMHKLFRSAMRQLDEQIEYDGTEIAPPIDSDVCG